MAKKKKKRSKRKNTPPKTGSDSRPSGPSIGRIVVRGGVVAMALAAGAYIWQSNEAGKAFDETAVLGKSTLSGVLTETDFGGGHQENVTYPVRFPTSGVHNPRWAEPGLYDVPLNKGYLVHALEHGNVVIYYDQPGAEIIDLLKLWSNLFQGPWSGLVVVPAPGLGGEVILTAWRKKLRLKPFVEATAAAFIDTYRGRGPENPVR